MKLLFAIPHYYSPGKAKYGSSESPLIRRVRAVAETIVSLHQLFGQQKCEINIGQKSAVPVGSLAKHQVDIVICTTGNHHTLKHLPVSDSLFHHRETEAEPQLLGFECHKVLHDNLGSYDYYCYMEDDLIIHDALFFEKLNQFNKQTEVLDLLQPHRYEVQHQGPYFKAYVDGDLRPEVTAPFQDVTTSPQLELRILGMSVRFRRPYNPHSASFFLNQAQLEYWVSQPHFLDRNTRFIGPLESAASLGIMKTFRIHKPAPVNPDFLEIKHADNRFIHQIGTIVSTSGQQQPTFPVSQSNPERVSYC